MCKNNAVERPLIFLFDIIIYFEDFAAVLGNISNACDGVSFFFVWDIHVKIQPCGFLVELKSANA